MTEATTAVDFKAEQAAILDRAQAEGRNITPDEEQDYLKMIQLRALSELVKEIEQDD